MIDRTKQSSDTLKCIFKITKSRQGLCDNYPTQSFVPISAVLYILQFPQQISLQISHFRLPLLYIPLHHCNLLLIALMLLRQRRYNQTSIIDQLLPTSQTNWLQLHQLRFKHYYKQHSQPNTISKIIAPNILILSIHH